MGLVYFGIEIFYEHNQMIIFTNGFIKKTQKTPSREITKAKAIREAYYEQC